MERQARIDPTTVVGWGVDADPRNDPTYPYRNRPENAAEDRGLTWERPTLQKQNVELLASTEHNRRTAVFGTSTPPRGLSGAIRREAFHKSEGKWGHWLMLMLADRIDVVEGVLSDLARGHVPNVPQEMGIRSELEHNMPGFTRKLMYTAAAAAAAYVIVQQLRGHNEPPPRRRAPAMRRHLGAARPARPGYRG